MGALKFLMKAVITIVVVLVALIFFTVVFGDEKGENGQNVSERDVPPPVEEMQYASHSVDDFEVEIPGWNVLTDEAGDERVIGVTKGVCSIIVNQYSARPGDIDKWIKQNMGNEEGNRLLSSSRDGDIYYFEFEQMFEDRVVTSTNKMFYCNYVTYVTTVMCVNDVMTEEYEVIRDYVLESAECGKEYEIPNLEQERREIEREDPEEAEEIEEIEDEIVKTNVGAEFGIDEELVVYFINGNDFFKKVLRDFPKANMVIKDDAGGRELKLRVLVDENGEITLLEDGEYSDADVTLIMPLQDAVNLFSNADNVNPLNLVAFAINVQTVPSSIKDEVIGKVLRGEYN
jgi:hypothetical protein